MPLYGHLKKFLYWHENLVNEEGTIDYSIPYAVDRKHSTCAYLLKLMLEGKAAIPPYYEGPRRSILEVDDSIQVNLNLKAMKDGRFVMSEQNILNFSKIVNGIMIDSLVTFLLIRQAMGENSFQEKLVIYEWMNMIGLTDDDVNWETLKKSSYRVRTYRNLPMFSNKGRTQEEMIGFPEKKKKNNQKNPFFFSKLSFSV
jgi:hypothetical protein